MSAKWHSVKHYLYRGKFNNEIKDSSEQNKQEKRTLNEQYGQMSQRSSSNDSNSNESSNSSQLNNYEIYRKRLTKEEFYKIYRRDRCERKILYYICSALCKCLFFCGLIAGIILLYWYLKPAEYLENCEKNSCIANLKCLNNKCKCDSNLQYFNRECVRPRLYGEPCGIIACDTAYDLVCMNGYCSCNYTKRWNGSYCLQGTYTDPCTVTSDCYPGVSLICTNGQCLCNSTNFWNGTYCTAKYPFNSSCTNSYECTSPYACVQGICTCDPSIQYWSSTLLQCQNYKTYTDSCISSTECSPINGLTCNTVNNNCSCPLVLGLNTCDCVKNSTIGYYWNGQTCVLRKSYSQSCSANYECKLTEGTYCMSGSCSCTSLNYFDGTQCVSKKAINQPCSSSNECNSTLICSGGTCQCNASAQYWSNTLQMCTNYLTYTNSCSSNECSPNYGLICNTISTSCSCPNVLGSGFCDCVKNSTVEYYWSGQTCVLRKSYSQPCSANYQCKVTEGTYCIFGSCSCTTLNYFDGTQCVSKKTINQPCSSSNECNSTLICSGGTCQCNASAQYWSNTLQMCTNYLTYTNSCSSNECSPNYGLICNTISTSCSCPTVLGSGFCDCVRNATVEYYWNGQTCVSRKTYSQACGANYECKLTEGTYCISGACSCTSLNYFNGTQCVSRKTINQPCSSSTECNSTLICSSGTCQCNASVHYWSSTLQMCTNYLTYTNSCSSNACSPNYGLICNTISNSCSCPNVLGSGFCDCVKNSTVEYYWDGQTCVSRKTYSQACGANYECNSIVGTYCTSGQCNCVSTQYFNGTYCSPKKTYNQPCSSSIECNDTFVCTNGICNCNSLTSYWSSTLQQCVTYRNYTQTCSASLLCNPSLNLICNSGTNNCNCPTTSAKGTCDCVRQSGNESYWNGTMCVSTKNYGESCSNTFECQSTTQQVTCYSGSCACGPAHMGLLNGQCYTCPSSLWLFYNNNCYLVSTSAGKSDFDLSSGSISTICFGSLAKLDNDGLINFLLPHMVSSRLYWVAASNYFNVNYSSKDGTWIVDQTKWCGGTVPCCTTNQCAYYDPVSQCFKSQSCTMNYYLICQFL